MSVWNNEEVVEKLLELKSNDYTESEIAEILSEEFNAEFSSESVGRKYRHLRDALTRTVNSVDVSDRNADLIKKLQRIQDGQRIERAGIRSLARYENFFEDYNTELRDLLADLNTKIELPTVKTIEPCPVGILHLSDLHLNEMVNIVDNTFDINIANKRLHKFTTKAINLFLSQGVGKVIIACTGDFITNDKKIDQLTTLSINRAQSVFIAVTLLENIITQLSQYFKVVLAGVSGNESRVQKDLGYNDFIASDNYDMTIYNILKYLYADKVQVIVDDANEVVLSINDQNIVLTHGYGVSRTIMEKSVSDVYTKYSKLGVNLRFVIFGHYHTAFLSTDFGRSGSLIGTNSYALFGLNMTGRATQNVHIVHLNGDIDSMLIDLQNTEGYSGYDITQKVEEFKIKTVNKPSEMVTYKV